MNPRLVVLVDAPGAPSRRQPDAAFPYPRFCFARGPETVRRALAVQQGRLVGARLLSVTLTI